MKEAEFRKKVTEHVKQIINYIADGKFSELLKITNINPTWYGEDGTPESGIKEFAEWLEYQLKIWEEDEGEEFVVDHFDEDQFAEENPDINEYKEGDNKIFLTYVPSSHGDQMEFWFEIKITIDENDKVTSVFNINT